MKSRESELLELIGEALKSMQPVAASFTNRTMTADNMLHLNGLTFGMVRDLAECYVRLTAALEQQEPQPAPAEGQRPACSDRNQSRLVTNCSGDPSMLAVEEPTEGRASGEQEHKWTDCKRADCHEWIRYCSICGMEDTCEDPLPPCPGHQPTDNARGGSGEAGKEHGWLKPVLEEARKFTARVDALMSGKPDPRDAEIAGYQERIAELAGADLIFRELLFAAHGFGYGDDGEMQGSNRIPIIDFKRDSADIIQRKIIERNMREQATVKDCGYQERIAALEKALMEVTVCETCEGAGELQGECIYCLTGEEQRCECDKEARFPCPDCDGKKRTYRGSKLAEELVAALSEGKQTVVKDCATEAENDRADRDAAKIARLTKERDEAAALNVYFRDSVGECHLMISRNTPEYQVRKNWDPTDLAPRLQKIMRAATTESGGKQEGPA